MASSVFLLLFVTASYLLKPSPTSAVQICHTSACHTEVGKIQVKFPFSLTKPQSSEAPEPECYYPGMQLSCFNGSHLQLYLASTSGHFTVHKIDYENQYLHAAVLGDCMPKEFMNFSVQGLPFISRWVWEYSFFNCSPPLVSTPTEHMVECMSGTDFSVRLKDVTAQSFTGSSSKQCKTISQVSLPYWLDMFFTIYPHNLFRLDWKNPDCRSCEKMGEMCRLKTNSSDVQVQCSCFANHRLSLFNAKYGLLIGLAQLAFHF